MKKLPFINKGYSANMRFADEHSYSPNITFFFFLLTIGISFALLFIRLFQLTIVKGSYYSRLANTNRTHEIVIEPVRGMIFDRKGIIIAQNAKPNLTSLDERLISSRTYADPAEALAPVVGYRQIADQTDLKTDTCLNKLASGDTIGKKGFEKLYDCDLRGVYGKKLVEVDAHGNYLKTISVLPPSDGKSFKLALDWELQKKTYELIKNKKAAVVALKPQNGELFVMASSPTFNPQDFEDREREKIVELLKNPDKPLFNRAAEGLYPPGSIFKLAVAVGALEEKKITERTIIEDNGSIKAGSLSFGNWYFLQYGKTDGPVDVVKAIRRSNDIFFYRIGELLGPNHIKKWAEIMGFGRKTGFGLDEAEGTIPSPFWKKEVLGESWFTGDTYNYSIGQGYALVTPLQIAQSTQALANNGTMCTPQLLRDAPGRCKKLPLSSKTLLFIQEGMKEACAPGGTGWPLFNFTVSHTRLESARSESEPIATDSNRLKLISTPIVVACKTGTAESNSASETPHAWFTAYAPAKNPEIVVTVLVEESGQGSDIAGPIVHDILTAYFERDE